MAISFTLSTFIQSSRSVHTKHLKTMRSTSQQHRESGHKPLSFIEGTVEFYRQRNRFHVIAGVLDTAVKEF